MNERDFTKMQKKLLSLNLKAAKSTLNWDQIVLVANSEKQQKDLQGTQMKYAPFYCKATYVVEANSLSAPCSIQNGTKIEYLFYKMSIIITLEQNVKKTKKKRNDC